MLSGLSIAWESAGGSTRRPLSATQRGHARVHSPLVSQNSCNVSIPSLVSPPVVRTGVIVGQDISISGGKSRYLIPEDYSGPDCFTAGVLPSRVTAEGTISENEMNLNGSGLVGGTFGCTETDPDDPSQFITLHYGFSCTENFTAVFAR